MKYSNYFVADANKKDANVSSLGKTYMAVNSGENKKVVLHEYPSSLLSVGNEYTQYSDFDGPDNNLTNAMITDSTSEECKQYCINRGQECKGFVYDKANNNCTLKGDIYPSTKREINKSKDIYTRMPEVKNNSSCPNGVKAISADFLNKNTLTSNNQMSMDFQCETEGGVMKVEEGLEKAYKTLTEEVGNLRGENEKIIQGFHKVREQVGNTIGNYGETEAKINQLLKENPTVNEMLTDAGKLETVFSMRNTAYVLALILLSIFLVRVLRK